MNIKRFELWNRMLSELEPSLMPIPKTGRIGYVKFENPYEYVGQTKPEWIDVDQYEFETVLKGLREQNDVRGRSASIARRLLPSGRKKM